MRSKLAAVLLFSAASCPAQQYLDDAAERARREFEVPGIAVAIVKDGNVVVEKGYGVRQTGESAPVTPHSLFRIASNTKAFTAAALAMLVDAGKLRWDDRVIDHLPAFQMYDPYVTREITVRDLLVHRSGLGLGAGDLMFWPETDFTREEIVQRIRFLRPATSFRSRYAYDNLLYLVAGQVVGAAAGESWDDFVAQRIFAPLGMTSTTTNAHRLKAAPDVAVPHTRVEGKLVVLPQAEGDNHAPAGAIASCASDMARWLIVQLRHCALAQGRLFSEAQSKEMWSPQTILPIDDLPAGAPAALAAVQPNFNAYGLGWMLRDYRGQKMVYHTGTLAGYVSRVTMLPDLQLGVVVLTNQEKTGAHTAIAYTVLDHYLGAPATDWVAVFRDVAKQEAAEAEAAVRQASGTRHADSRPSLPLASYAGRYRDSWYGDIVIEERGGKLSLSFTHSKQLTGDLEHWQYDTFVARWRDRTLGADAYVTFHLKPDGSIEEIKMAPVSPLTDFSFDFQDLLFRPVAAGTPPR